MVIPVKEMLNLVVSLKGEKNTSLPAVKFIYYKQRNF